MPRRWQALRRRRRSRSKASQGKGRGEKPPRPFGCVHDKRKAVRSGGPHRRKAPASCGSFSAAWTFSAIAARLLQNGSKGAIMNTVHVEEWGAHDESGSNVKGGHHAGVPAHCGAGGPVCAEHAHRGAGMRRRAGHALQLLCRQGRAAHRDGGEHLAGNLPHGRRQPDGAPVSRAGRQPL